MNTSIVEQRIAPGGSLDGTWFGSTGTIDTVAAAALASGDVFGLRSLRSSEVVEFRFFDPSSERPSNERLLRWVPIVSGEGATEVADRLVAEINRARALALFAHRSNVAEITLTHRLGGTKTNYSHPADEVADAGFVVSDMTGGTEEPRSFTEDGITYYDQAATGGLITFEFVTPKMDLQRVGQNQVARFLSSAVMWRLERVLLSASGGTEYTLQARTADNQVRTLVNVTTAMTVPIEVEGPFELFHNERLEVVVAGVVPSGGWWVRAYARPVDVVPATAGVL